MARAEGNEICNVFRGGFFTRRTSFAGCAVKVAFSPGILLAEPCFEPHQ